MHTILLVDDQLDVREALQCMLEAHGFQVITAADAATALQIAREQTCDAALIDVGMPEINGIELCRLLREASDQTGRALRVALITGFADSEMQEMARTAGACVVLNKPIATRELARRIREMIADKPNALTPIP
jgi:DNA-binding response OmpR family regulator